MLNLREIDARVEAVWERMCVGWKPCGGRDVRLYGDNAWSKENNPDILCGA